MKIQGLKFIMLMSFMASVSFTNAQIVVGGNQSKAMDMNTTPLGTISTFGLPEKTTTGSHYLLKEWQSGVIELKNGKIQSIPLNFDVKNGVVEIKTEKDIKAVDLKKVVSIVMEDGNRKFVGGESLAGLGGVVEVLFESDSLYLLKKHFLVVQKANYNAALDMGNNEDKIIIKSTYFIKLGFNVFEVGSKKNIFFSNFEDDSIKESVIRYFDDHKISLKDEADLIELCQFINQWLTT